MAEPLPGVSVVMPTYRRRAMLPLVVAPVLADPATTELIVVVDGCDDGSLDLLREWARDEPRLRPVWQENAGQGPARQHGVDLARGEIVVVLDDDVVASPGMITGHAAWHVPGTHRLVLGYLPVELPVRRRPGQATTRLYSASYEEVCAAYERDAACVLERLWAGNLSMRRADALRVGLWTLGGLRYHEDQQFGFRCTREHLEPVFDRRLGSTHLHRRTLRAFRAECRQQGEARCWLAVQYPDLAPVRDATRELPGHLALLVDLLSVPVLAPVVGGLLAAISTCAGLARWWAGEDTATRLLRQVELRRGLRRFTPTMAREAARGRQFPSGEGTTVQDGAAAR